MMRSEKGFSLVEVLISLVLISIIASGFLGAMTDSYKYLLLAKERTVAESIARSQIEYIENQPYNSEKEYLTIAVPDGFEIIPVIDSADVDTGIETDIETGMQKISVTVEHFGEQVITLESYKVER